MIKIYNQDCMMSLKETPCDHYDLAIVDPPYGIGNFIHDKKPHKVVKWNDKIPTEEYFYQLKRVSKNQIIWGCNYYPNLLGGRIIWYKHVRHPNMSKCEIAYCSFFKKVEYIDLIWQNINRREPIIHPCQKPVLLYSFLLKKYASEGYKILDTHLGSGSIAIACYDLGLDLTGYEIDENYYNAAIKRLHQHKRQLNLFQGIG